MIAAPINPADINVIQGKYPINPPVPAIGGSEGCGQVIALGEEVSSLKVGDFVIPAKPGLGTWRSHGVFSEENLVSVPKTIPPELLSVISVNPCTAYRLLNDFVSLQQGDVIIQNGANSMVGASVIQLARERGIKTINVIRDKDPVSHMKVVEVLKQLGGDVVLGESYFHSPRFQEIIADLPAPKLGLNCVGGQNGTNIARSLANGGTMVTYGGMSLKPVTVPTSTLIFKDITLKGFWMTRWYQQHSKKEREEMLHSIIGKVKEEKLQVFVERWNIKQYEIAFNQDYKGRKPLLTFK